MPKVYHRSKRYHMQFRKLPFAQAYWLATNTATAPFIKRGRNAYISGWNSDGSVATTTLADVSVDCVKVPEVFMSQNRTSQ